MWRPAGYRYVIGILLIQIPFQRIIRNVFPDFVQVIFIPNHVLIIIPLPYRFIWSATQFINSFGYSRLETC